MKTIYLKRILSSVRFLLCLSAVLVACSSELDEMDNVTKQSSRAVFDSYIDIDSELIETGMLYENGQESNRYMEALFRFDSYVKIENGLLSYCGGTSEDLNISEYLFELFTDKMEQTNQEIQNSNLIVFGGSLYSSVSFNNALQIMRVKSRTTETGWSNYTPGRLDGSPQEVGQSILDAIRQFCFIANSSQYYGYLGDYVNLQSYGNWSQGNSMLSGQFTFQNSTCNYSLTNLNAATVCLPAEV